MMEREKMIQIIVAALGDLRKAVEELQKAKYRITPSPPMIRPRTIWFSEHTVWPGRDDLLQVETRGPWYNYSIISITWNAKGIAEAICQDDQFRPRQVLRSIRRIQAAVAWCRARVEGYKRAAADIERAQSRAVEALEAEAALAALKK